MAINSKRRVVVTGLGVVSPLGASVEATWRNILQGKSGVVLIDDFDVEHFPCRIAGLVPHVGKKTLSNHEAVSHDNALATHVAEEDYFDAERWMDKKLLGKMDRFIVYGIAAALQAFESSGLKLNDAMSLRAGVIMGSGIGGLPAIEETTRILHNQGPRRVSPFFIPSCLINLLSGHVSIMLGLKGPNHAVVTACASGSHAIGDAARMIARGDADIMVTGGAEAAVCPLGLAGFCSARALSLGYNATPKQASRPFDVNRDGFVMGEGAGALVLEEYEHARQRGAFIYAEVVGYGLSSDAHHMTAPHPEGEGAYNAMRMALNDAELMPQDIQYVNAHGTSTPVGDVIELRALERLYGSQTKVTVSSTKSFMGHLLGGAGAVEAAIVCLSLRDGLMHPTLNLEQKEGTFLHLNTEVIEAPHLEYAMSNSFGFGGTNASLIFRRFVD